MPRNKIINSLINAPAEYGRFGMIYLLIDY